MSASDPYASAQTPRNIAIASGVVLLHAAALWGLQQGLIRRPAEIVVPVVVLAEIVEPPKPKVEPPPPAPLAPPAPVPPPPAPEPPPPPKPPPPPPPPPPAPEPPPKPVRKPPPPAPKPRAIREPVPTPAPNAPVGEVAPQPPAPPIAAPVAPPAPAPPAPPAPPPPAPPAPPRVELPSTNADYLRNPPPAYPAMSKRLGEQGKVVVSVMIGVDGRASDAQIGQSSGYDRLDRVALDTVLKWRYVPGKRGGVPEAMRFNVPITFVLE